MAARQNTIWEKFLAPVARLLIDEEDLKRYARSIDWEKESDRFRRPEVKIPAYYSSQNFHGIEGGYLNSGAAVSYDPITQYVLPPNETLVRQGLLERIRVKPRRIIDLGCGTGSMTLMLKQAFPQAEVIGLDLSPYMLVRAEDKAKTAGLAIEWLHGNAEETKLPDTSFDLVTISLLFHETPAQVTQAILQESFRLLKVGGEAIVLDGNQQALHHLDWLNDIFEEPYIREFAAGNLDAWMDKAGFAAVQSDGLWLVHQVTRGIKPLTQESKVRSQESEEDMVITEEWIPSPGY